jgi:hypothetical protein
MLNNITITNGQNICYDATQNIYIAGSGSTFVVAAGGNTHLVAGHSVYFYPGTTVQNGGHLHAYSAFDCIYCTSPKNALLAAVPDSSVGPGSEGNLRSNDLFRVYPNPTTGHFTLDIPEAEPGAQATIELYGNQGVCIARMSSIKQQHMPFDIANYPSGLYFLRVSNGGSVTTMKIVKL